MGKALFIIEDHCDGTLEAENSENEAVFTIRLPLDSKEELMQ